ncbi:hypothetical protein HUJ04_000886 [Dendroctonus ponderosae]|nr:hypothetical protein HUJ04_000886 [Dendroctonus ponderosae]
MSLAKPDCDSIEIEQVALETPAKKTLSYSDIASKLLEDKFLLTALELHTEFVEAGKEIKVLRDFFSNPGNFEASSQETTTRLSRCGSQATLDSLDLTRYSEDGAVGDERVAVLEFELRKAKETINALRNNLTFAIESESSTPDKGSLRNIPSTSIKPYEQRALNFLINEYLLLQGYKLTSITFADENQNQDFDDWDDVGLNICKPPELLFLYREGLKQSGQSGLVASTQTEIGDDEKDDLIRKQFNLRSKDVGLFGVPELTTHEGFYDLKQNCVAKTNSLIEEALSGTRKRKMVEVFDEISDCLCQVADLAEFIRLSHPQSEYNYAAQVACGTVSGIVETLNTNIELYEVLRNATRKGDFVETSEVDKHVGELFLFDFEQCGIHFCEDKRNQVVALNDEILQLGQRFVAGTSTPRFIRKDMLPPNIRHLFMSDGEKIFINGLYTDSNNPMAREVAYKLFLHPDPNQEYLLSHLLDARDKLGQICGFTSYSDRALRGSTIDTPENLSLFLNSLKSDLWEKAQSDFRCMDQIKQNESLGHGPLASWDVPYYTQTAKKEWFKVSSKEYSPYFSLGACMDGLNMLFQSLYGIQLINTEVSPGECWFTDVYKLSVVDETEGLLGYIYCDLYERTGKPNQDCHFTIRGGKQLPDGSYQSPIVVLMLNLPPPRWSSPSLLSPNMVDNLFHEMGHAMHSMLGRTQYQHVTGTRCSTDFAEVPSILMEYFASDTRVLKHFARHFQTKQPMTDAMLNRLCASKHLFTASETQLQVFYAALDQAYHGKHPIGGSTTEVLAEIQKEYYGLPYVPSTAWQLRFSHLIGYGAKYYSYLVSRAVAYLIWKTYFEKDPLSRTSGEKYRRECLAFGGGKNPKQLVGDFLNMEPTASAFAKALINEIDHHQSQVDAGCEIEELKSQLDFLEADLAELQSLKEQLQKEYTVISDDIISSELKTAVKTSECSDSPERFEIIDKNMSLFKKKDIEDTISNNSFNTSDWAKISLPDQECGKESNSQKMCENERLFKDLSLERFTKDVFSLCYLDIEHSFECDALDEHVDVESFVHIISQTLPKIIPNIILNKREEVIPLLMTAISLNPKISERDKLLQQLFHLKKRPTKEERLTILAAVIGIAKYSGEQLVENEILPQCWLQLTHKHVERRLLIAEACTVLIPYVSVSIESTIRNSLILSMLQQMLEDKEEIVRDQIIKAFALLLCYCKEPDKYSQCEQIALNTLNDVSHSVVHLSSNILFPVLARWAQHEGCLNTSLLKKLLHRLNSHVKNIESQTKASQDIDQIQRVLSVLDNLLPFLLTLVIYNEHVISNIEKDVVIPTRSDFSSTYTKLTNPENFFKSELHFGTVLYEFDKYISDNPNTSWPEMNWVVDVMYELPDLLNNLHHIELAQQPVLEGFINLFAHICIVFGPNFINYKVRPVLHKNIQNLEQVISSFNQFCPSLNIIPIYVIVLHFTENFDEISSVLKKFLYVLPLCGSPLDCLELTVRKLTEVGLQEIVVDCLWSGVVHQRPLVKSASANLFCCIIRSCSEDLLKSKVAGAIVTMANDSDVLVRTATIPALGRLITNCSVKEIHDKAYMQLQTLLNDPTLTENHALTRQLIVTLGNIFVGSCSTFRNDVILPQLTSFAVFMSQMTNQTRKIDMALALVEAFTHVVYSPLNKPNISSVVKPGLKCLDLVISENPSLSTHHETVLSMMKECDNKASQSVSGSPIEKPHKLGQNVNQGVEEMRQRMSKIFTKPHMSKSNTLHNFPGIFKKK